jgi:hypothetical protein
MTERNVQRARAQRAHFDDYVRETAGGGAAAEIEKAKALDGGALTPEEFDALKRKALASALCWTPGRGESSTRANTGGDLEPREEIGE